MPTHRSLALPDNWVLAAASCLLLALSAAAAEPGSTPIRVVTWNVAGHACPAQAQALFADTADIIALQECPEAESPVSSNSGSEWQAVYEHTNAILSRWPIMRSGLVAANPAWPRDLPWADIQPPTGPLVRVYSVHLTFKRAGNPFLRAARAVEARRILIHALSFHGPVVLAGDFNSIGWIVDGQASEPAIELLQASGYSDAFRTIGGRTHALLGRLDWIFTMGFRASQQRIGDFEGSDHRWLLASLSLTHGASETSPAALDTSPYVFLAAAALAIAGIVFWRRRRRSR